MPSFRKKVQGFIRQLSNPGSCITESEEFVKSPGAASPGSFIQQYLNGEVHSCHPDILCGRSFQELPTRPVQLLQPTVRAAFTGPLGGLTKVRRQTRQVDVRHPHLDFIDEDPAGRTAQLAQQEDLDEFLPDGEEGGGGGGGEGEERPPRPPPRHHRRRQRGRPQQQRQHHNGNGVRDNNNAAENGTDHHSSTTTMTAANTTTATTTTTIDSEWPVLEQEQEQEDGFEGDQATRDRLADPGYVSGSDALAWTEQHEIAGVRNWNRPHLRAYGQATSLYERHPVTLRHAGDPIADAFAVCARDNNAVLVLADGVNWGEKSCLAARCAVHGCVDYVNRAIFHEREQVRTTKDIFFVLLRSLFAAHHLILQEDGMLTTLCVAFVCPLADSDNYVVCACNVGDSLAYVYSKAYGVREVTQGSHDIYSMRDMRDALGALGPVDGINPELSNLTCSMTAVDEGDIVFLTSDGISDNFDPVVGKFAVPREDNNNGRHKDVAGSPSAQTGPINGKSTRNGSNHHPPRNGFTVNEDHQSSTTSTSGNTLAPPPTCLPGPPPPFDWGLPTVEAHQRHALTLLRMEDLLTNGVSIGDVACEDARQVCDSLIDFAYKLTVAKRRILEDPDLYTAGDEFASVHEQKRKRKRLGDKLAMVPGKLDHASVVAYQVGMWPAPRRPPQPPAASPEQFTAEEEEEETTDDVIPLPLDRHPNSVVVSMTTVDHGSDDVSGSLDGNKENVSPTPRPISALSLVCHPRQESHPKESLV